MNTVATSLDNIFRKHRLVFWYDPGEEMREEYDGYSSEDIVKVQVSNNEFGLKHRMLRQEPEKSFLVYLPYNRPETAENWFLDLELGHRVFYADGVSLILQEMGWMEEHREFVEEHREFFNGKDRRERLKNKLHDEDEVRDWKLKMVSVVCRESPTLEDCLLTLLKDLIEDREEKWDSLGKYGLEAFFWDSISRTFDYQSESPTLLDLVIEIFVCAAPSACAREPRLGKEALLFLGRWKDSTRYREVFQEFSRKIQEDLNVGSQLDNMDGYVELLPLDAFEAIEKKIIIELREGISRGDIQANKTKEVLEKRENSYWFPDYESIYRALVSAVNLLDAIKTVDFSFESCSEGMERYVKHYWKIDQLYRHFHYHLKVSRQATLLNEVREILDGKYTNEFLLRLGDHFQRCLDQKGEWKPEQTLSQKYFWKSKVSPFLTKNQKVFVVISDALRYEVAEELQKRILREDRFSSKLEYRISMLPSYTQLGMAALLPNETLEISPENGDVRVDGLPAKGLEGRKSILASHGVKTIAVKGADFLAMNSRDEGRELTKEHDVIYIYQNWIDHVGDKRETEGDVFEATEKEMETLIAILKKIYAINGSNVLLTSDHGFLYQNEVPEESDFTQTPSGEDCGMVNRRFAFAKKFNSSRGSSVFQASDLELTGDYEVAIPKSINRYRKQGSGARFVHGGATLQEVVLPLLTINKSRKDDTEPVDVDIIRSGSQVITTSQATVSFYQSEPVRDKILGRTLLAGFYAQDGTLLSDQKELNFDSDEEDARMREKKVSFVFGKKADQPEYRNSEVYLKLEERIPRSNHYRAYKQLEYRLRKAFESDFEF